MGKTIFFSLDLNCVTDHKIDIDCLGGTERFMVLWAKDLRESGYNVTYEMKDSYKTHDLCIHSNVFHPRIMARKHILWAGSWHAQGREHVDKVIVNSQFMKDRLRWNEAIVIPAPYDNDLLAYKSGDRIGGRIVCHSNPNRHFHHTVKICKMLKEMGENFEFRLTGGNKLYAESFPESNTFENPELGIYHTGPIPRTDMLTLLSSASVWAYPNLTDNSETLGVAALEAAALGIPLILPKRRPFVDILPEAEFADSTADFAEKIAHNLRNKEKIQYRSLSTFHKTVVFASLREMVKGIIGAKND